MKFGKLIRAQALKHPKFKYISYKLLKNYIKTWVRSLSENDAASSSTLDTLFYISLFKDIKDIQLSVQNEFEIISDKYNQFLDIDVHRINYNVAANANKNTVSQWSNEDDSFQSSHSIEITELCSHLNNILSLCKELRRNVLWNSVGIIKILKKRSKYLRNYPHAIYLNISATKLLQSQDWYRSEKLSQVISHIETAVDSLMQQLTTETINSERYKCPLCLDIILDPVCLRICGHRFCWACLCMAYCEKAEGVLERCPCCRTVFPLDPDAFYIDTVYSRFLTMFFPEDRSERIKEQQEQMCNRLFEVLSGYKSRTTDSIFDKIKTPKSVMTVPAEKINCLTRTSAERDAKFINIQLQFDNVNNTAINSYGEFTAKTLKNLRSKSNKFFRNRNELIYTVNERDSNSAISPSLCTDDENNAGLHNNNLNDSDTLPNQSSCQTPLHKTKDYLWKKQELHGSPASSDSFMIDQMIEWILLDNSHQHLSNSTKQSNDCLSTSIGLIPKYPKCIVGENDFCDIKACHSIHYENIDDDDDEIDMICSNKMDQQFISNKTSVA